MKSKLIKLALSSAVGGVLMLSSVSAMSAGDVSLSANQQFEEGSINLDTDGMYLVRLADPAVALYEGGIKGLQATSAKATGKKRLDTNSKAAKRYKKHLQAQQEKVLQNAGEAFGRDLNPEHNYHYATNGFAVVLTAAEAKALRNMDGVTLVERERMEKLHTDVGPAWIGAPEIWNNKPSGTQGEGVVVAVLDTGINSDHPSFADVGADGYDHDNPLGSGNYVPGSYCDTTDASFCNDKLIGAWDFDVVDGPNPEDDDGHGSHTASTAAGNFVNGAEILAPTTSASFDISGVAPHANIIAYDVCHWTSGGGSCPGAATAAAIDQVLVDAANLPNGIAALNYSISGGGDPYNSYVEMGFLAAVEAGVYVAASAGNAGTDGSVAHLGPWVSTTAASTHNRQLVNQVIDVNSDDDSHVDIRGLGLTSGYGPATIVNSADYEADFPGATLCGVGSIGDNISPWPPGFFNGEIVACTRGTFGRVEKGMNVLAAGAGGYILMDNGGGLVGDSHVLPAVHISQSDGAALAEWLANNSGDNPMASIEGFTYDYDPANGDVMAGFSSRGPQGVMDVLKPDITAPGVDIMGADADRFGQYQIISGTSMSSPHNAGAGALMTASRPDLTPVEIKSALMMSSTNEFTVKPDGVTPTDPHNLGAGRIDLDAAKEAGLVLSESHDNFMDANPETGGDPSTLNLASMMALNCVGICSWTRTVTNPEKSTSHWNVTSSVDGVEVTTEVSPEANSDEYNLKLKKGQSATITVTADTSLASDGWHFGEVNLDRNLDKGPDLHMPIAVYASKATNPALFTKTVDAAAAEAGDTLTYELTVTNGPMMGPITVTDMVPEGTSFVDASETESVVNGSTSSAWSYDAGSNSLMWTGELDPGGLDVSDGLSPFGYFSLAGLGVPPLASGCNGDCDDGGFYFTGLPAYTYNGATYTSSLFSVNGTVEAGDASLSFSSFANQNLPDATPPNNILAPFWRDLNQSAGGEMYAANLNVGCGTVLVYEWENVPHYGSSDTVTMQVWVGNNGGCLEGGIWYVYANIDDPTANATVGAENAAGDNGSMYYYNGTGTPVGAGTELMVSTLQGGTATLGFQVTTDACADVVNEAEMSNDGNDERAIAATSCP